VIGPPLHLSSRHAGRDTAIPTGAKICKVLRLKHPRGGGEQSAHICRRSTWCTKVEKQ
jgi:hypothetical protein